MSVPTCVGKDMLLISAFLSNFYSFFFTKKNISIKKLYFERFEPTSPTLVGVGVGVGADVCRKGHAVDKLFFVAFIFLFLLKKKKLQ